MNSTTYIVVEENTSEIVAEFDLKFLAEKFVKNINDCYGFRLLTVVERD